MHCVHRLYSASGAESELQGKVVLKLFYIV